MNAAPYENPTDEMRQVMRAAVVNGVTVKMVVTVQRKWLVQGEPEEIRGHLSNPIFPYRTRDSDYVVVGHSRKIDATTDWWLAYRLTEVWRDLPSIARN